MWNPDSDHDKWGLSFLEIEKFFSYGYYGDYGYDYNTNDYDQQPYDARCYQGNYYPDVNSDILISLEQRLSGLSITDGNQSSHAKQDHQQELYPVDDYLQVSSNPVPEHLHASNYPVSQFPSSTTNQGWCYDPLSLASNYQVSEFSSSTTNQDWCYDPLSLNYHHGNEEGMETNQISKSSPYSSSQNQSCDIDEEDNLFLEITHEPEFDGEVKKRPLDRIITVPHTPKVNGDIPSIDEASSDHQRLQERLKIFNFVESIVEGDGNGQFRALSDQLYHTVEHHNFVRRKILMQLKSNPKLYEGYVPMAYTDYLKQISKSGVWGDHVTLQAAADSYGVRIIVLTSFKDTKFIEILPKVLKAKRVIFLSYWAEVHYNSMYPVGELPPSGMEKKKSKKKWWNFKIRPQAYLN